MLKAQLSYVPTPQAVAGYAILNGDDQNAEWGYISFNDLKGIKIGFVEIDCELENLWKIKPASQIDNIKT